MQDVSAEYIVKESDLVPAGGANRFTVRSHMNGAPADARMQIQPGGTIHWNTAEQSTGEWEVCTRVGAKVVWTSSVYPTGAFALPLAEGV